MSVVLAALDDYTIIEQVHWCVEAQTIRPDLEVILVCRSEEALDLPDRFTESYPDIVVIEMGDEVLLNEARAAGARRASAPYVLILEDHCLPFPDCLERMVSRLREGWTAVGPALVSGNTVSRVGIAANFLTYGQWMGCKRGGQRSFVAGYNSAFSLETILARGDRLTQDLIAPSALQMELAREGHRFYFEHRAVMAHWEASTFRGVRRILSGNGRALGMVRARRWSTAQKVLASLLNPILIGSRFLRGVAAFSRAETRHVASLMLLMPLALLWTLAELGGYWCTNAREAIEGMSDVERNRQRFVDPREPILAHSSPPSSRTAGRTGSAVENGSLPII
jgi:Glycosyl transferase family 2